MLRFHGKEVKFTQMPPDLLAVPSAAILSGLAGRNLRTPSSSSSQRAPF